MKIKPDKYSKVLPPPPVVLISTLYGDVKNLAPYGMNMPISFDPPLFAFGVRDTRDTFKNILDNGEFVVAVPGPKLIRVIDITAESFPREVSEFEEAGLTPVESEVVRPYSVGECQSNLECRLEWLKQAGDHFIVVGKVVAANIHDSIYKEDLSRILIDPIYHVGSSEAEYAGKGPLLINE